MTDDFLGVGLPSYDGAIPPDLEAVVRASQAIEELAAAAELIRESRAPLARMLAIAVSLVQHGTALTDTARDLRAGVSAAATNFALVLQDEADPASAEDIAPILAKMRDNQARVRDKLWPWSQLAPLYARYAECVRIIGEAEQDFEWLNDFAQRSSALSEFADRNAKTLTTLAEAADASSQLVALMEFVVEQPSEQRAYQVQQAIELAESLNAAPDE